MTKLKNFLPYYLYFIFYLPWMLFVAPLSFRGREVIRIAATRMGFKKSYLGVIDEKNFPISTLDARDITGMDFGMALHEPNSHDGSVTTYELMILNKLVQRRDPKLIVEFGTFDGRTAMNFAANAPTAKVVTIDFAPQPRVFDGQSIANNIECKLGDSTQLDISPYRGKAEFIFVDGGHDAPVVTSDTLKALDMVSPNGMIVWHDYRDFKGVQEAIAVAVQRRGDENFRFIRDTSMVAYQPAGFAAA
ncbi:MAG TPA: class I SAM-dependent methyltransferase [Xanthobacteraceae bacterium]|jgi:predicted O-methyltransferase YrrM